jgi:hypothetical protein
MTRLYFATYNTHADLRNGNRGFLNSWELLAFTAREGRARFVADAENRLARVVTQKEARRIFHQQYESVGKKPPLTFADATDQMIFLANMAEVRT